MRTPILCFLLFLACNQLSHGQEVSPPGDSSAFYKTAQELLIQQRYATLHTLLDSALYTQGLQPGLVCRMVDNVLKNHFWRQGQNRFYLRDKSESGMESSSVAAAVVVVRDPDVLLRKLIEAHPQSASAYKLLGDFYRIQLTANPDLERLAPVVAAELGERVAGQYAHAVQLGYLDSAVNRWLGNYYLKAGRPRLAREHFQRNVDAHLEDASTFTGLARINFAEKQYSQGLKFAESALEHTAELSVADRYEMLRIAALSLFQLGERERFLEYNQQCLRLLPARQEAYLDLCKYLAETNQFEREAQTLTDMLLNDPLDDAGYQYLVKFCVRQDDFRFGDQLLDRMAYRFEHSDAAMGNIYRFRGNLSFMKGDAEEARKLWEVSRSYFGRFLPEDHPLFKEIGDISRESSLR